MKITRNGKPSPLPPGVTTVDRLARYMTTVIGWAGEVQLRHALTFFKRRQTYTIGDGTNFWVFYP